MTCMCPRCWFGDKAVLPAVIRYSEIFGLIVYAEHVLSPLECVQLTDVYIIMIIMSKEFKVAVLIECIWRTRMKVITTETFISIPVLLYYIRYHLMSKKSLKRRQPPRSKWEKSWKYVV